MVHDIMKNLFKERPVGSKNNRDILLYLEDLLVKMGYDIKKLPFICTTCETGELKSRQALFLSRLRVPEDWRLLKAWKNWKRQIAGIVFWLLVGNWW